MPKEEKETKEDKIRFFGEVDLNQQGGIKSDMPAWYFDVHIEELEEGIRKKQRMLDTGAVEIDQIPLLRSQIEGESKKLKEIISSRPHLTDKQRDTCYKVYQNLARQIADTMPTRKETKDGLVNPQNELKRLKTKHITINPEIASACGVKAHQGKITGDEANKCYQILGKMLGENTMVERLRKDSQIEAYKTTHDLVEKILRGMEVGRA